jgi:hypothetical protein
MRTFLYAAQVIAFALACAAAGCATSAGTEHGGGLGTSPTGPSQIGQDAVPAWLTIVIQQLQTQPVGNPPASVARYEYKGDTVYFVPQRCCDIASVVYRSDGTVMCQADGGFTGKGDGRCPDFLAERRNERILWRDPRG